MFVRKKHVVYKMTPDLQKIREGILACVRLGAEKNIAVSQYDIVKTFFLADRSHLNRFGRPISFDNYVAMKHGPVPSFVYDVLKENLGAVEKIGGLLWKRRVALELGASYFAYFDPAREEDTSILSPSDLELIKSSFASVKNLGFKQIRKLTHEDAAYLDAWEDDGNRKQFPMSYALLFENTNDAMALHLSEASELI